MVNIVNSLISHVCLLTLSPLGSMVVFGGHNFESIDYQVMDFVGLKNDMWRYDFSSAHWTEIVPNLSSPKPLPRMHHTAIIRDDGVGGEIMVITGGTTFLRYSGVRSTIYKACGREDVWEFNFATGNWTQLVEDHGACNSALKQSFSAIMYIVVLVNILASFM